MKFKNRSLPVLLAIVLGCSPSNLICIADEPNSNRSTDLTTEPITFNKHVAPILFNNCVECHRTGEVAPFSLLTYADAKRRAGTIAAVTSKGAMPPWKGSAAGAHFVGQRGLTESEIGLIADWVEQGRLEGEAEDLPAVPKFTEGWKLGEPDIVVQMPESFTVPAEGSDVYRNFVMDFELPAGRYIKAIEYRPSNRRVVHHALLTIDREGKARREEKDDDLPGSFSAGSPIGQLLPGCMATWTPGRDPVPQPDGLSVPWTAGADLVLQLHLHPSGKFEVEQSSIGIFLTDQPPKRSMADILLIDTDIDIAPGEKQFKTRAEVTLPIAVEAMGLFPHMHLIGRKMHLIAHPPQGEPIPLLQIDDWDFNWQTYYQYKDSIKLPAGTRVVLEAVHDNSADNPANPSNPPQRVTWGEQTTNEMSLAFFQIVPMNEPDFDQLLPYLKDSPLGFIRAADYR
jgi:hypothetical protein